MSSRTNGAEDTLQRPQNILCVSDWVPFKLLEPECKEARPPVDTGSARVDVRSQARAGEGWQLGSRADAGLT